MPKGVPHPANCGHCISIRGDRNPAKRRDVRAKISEAALQPTERERRREAVRGDRSPTFSHEGSIKAAHHRVVTERGTASKYQCATLGCNRQAQEWALNKDSTEIVWAPVNSRGYSLPYSMNTSDYDALCKSCHRKRDARRAEEK